VNLPFNTEHFFYLVSVPAVLLLGISKSGLGVGLGSLAVSMMVMAWAVSVPRAAAILMPVLFAMDALGMAAFRKDLDKRLLRFMLPFALCGILIGTMLFKYLDAQLCKLFGALALGSLADGHAY
jgi:uncharacterized protein